MALRWIFELLDGSLISGKWSDDSDFLNSGDTKIIAQKPGVVQFFIQKKIGVSVINCQPPIAANNLKSVKWIMTYSVITGKTKVAGIMAEEKNSQIHFYQNPEAGI